jgi:hypothetical protein
MDDMFVDRISLSPGKQGPLGINLSDSAQWMHWLDAVDALFSVYGSPNIEGGVSMSGFKPEPLEIQGETHFNVFDLVYAWRRSLPRFCLHGHPG